MFKFLGGNYTENYNGASQFRELDPGIVET
jgi:hypothetical protein